MDFPTFNLMKLILSVQHYISVTRWTPSLDLLLKQPEDGGHC